MAKESTILHDTSLLTSLIEKARKLSQEPATDYYQKSAGKPSRNINIRNVGFFIHSASQPAQNHAKYVTKIERLKDLV